MEYIKATELNQIPELNRKIYFLAGTTDIYVQMKDEMLVEPNAFVDISGISGLSGVIETKNSIVIGPLTTFTEAAGNRLIKKYASILVAASEAVGSPQIRNRGTFGGNIGNSSPAGDSLPALTVLEAKMKLFYYGKIRVVGISDFFTGPKRNILRNGELITEIIIPKNDFNFASYKKLAGRSAFAISKVSLAIAAEIKNKKIDDIKIAAGAVGQTVLKCADTEHFLKGKPITYKTINLAAVILRQEISPIDDIRSNKNYRTYTAGALLVKSFSQFFT